MLFNRLSTPDQPASGGALPATPPDGTIRA
jgi:hypothetical protein